MKLRKENQQISEENNLLKLKIDILLDMASIFFIWRSYEPLFVITCYESSCIRPVNFFNDILWNH